MMSRDWSGQDFAEIMWQLTDDCPIAIAYEQKYLPGEHWWENQREHLCHWFFELDGPGAYERQKEQTAKSAYNHFQCAPGLLWLAEALGEATGVVREAAEAAGGVGRPASQCAKIRKIIPWPRIAELADRAEREG